MPGTSPSTRSGVARIAAHSGWSTDGSSRSIRPPQGPRTRGGSQTSSQSNDGRSTAWSSNSRGAGASRSLRPFASRSTAARRPQRSTRAWRDSCYATWSRRPMSPTLIWSAACSTRVRASSRLPTHIPSHSRPCPPLCARRPWARRAAAPRSCRGTRTQTRRLRPRRCAPTPRMRARAPARHSVALVPPSRPLHRGSLVVPAHPVCDRSRTARPGWARAAERTMRLLCALKTLEAIGRPRPTTLSSPLRCSSQSKRLATCSRPQRFLVHLVSQFGGVCRITCHCRRRFRMHPHHVVGLEVAA
mmetsp:Transcript_17813/g.53755  ORF Transcript_17813/g.53755 Transcript_17813/m.53755 type:complete len:302 (-) Transcript_17813:4196-5101(-)